MDALSSTNALCRENNGPLLLGYAWALISLAVLTVALRIFFRLRARNGMHWDDYFVAASLVSCILTNGVAPFDRRLRLLVSLELRSLRDWFRAAADSTSPACHGDPSIR